MRHWLWREGEIFYGWESQNTRIGTILSDQLWSLTGFSQIEPPIKSGEGPVEVELGPNGWRRAESGTNWPAEVVKYLREQTDDVYVGRGLNNTLHLMAAAVEKAIKREKDRDAFMGTCHSCGGQIAHREGLTVDEVGRKWHLLCRITARAKITEEERDKLQAELAEAKTRITELEDALQPFAKAAAGLNGSDSRGAIEMPDNCAIWNNNQYANCYLGRASDYRRAAKAIEGKP